MVVTTFAMDLGDHNSLHSVFRTDRRARPTYLSYVTSGFLCDLPE